MKPTRDRKPRKKATSQAERMEYAQGRAEDVVTMLRNRADRRHSRAEKKGEEPVGYRTVYAAGGPRTLGSTEKRQVPVYQDELDFLVKASQVDPNDYYHAVGLSGVRKGGEFSSLCKEGNKGAGASVACNPRKAKKLAKGREKRQGRAGKSRDNFFANLMGRLMTRGSSESMDTYNPFQVNPETQARIDAQSRAQNAGVTLYR